MLFILIGSGVTHNVSGVPELDSRVSRRVTLKELIGNELRTSLKLLHPLFASTSDDVLTSLAEYAKGNLRNWARVLEVASSYNIDNSSGIAPGQANYIIRSITGGSK
jgi:hypothetical protein